MTLEEVGEENVVQVVTRNESNYKAAGKMLVGKRTTGGKLAQRVVMDDKFWKSIVVCLKGADPLIKLLHLVSSDTKPVIGFIYEEMKRAKEKIQHSFKCVKKHYMPLWTIIDEGWNRQILWPLNATSYSLNPQFHYNPNFKAGFEVKHGLYECLCKLVTKQDWSKVDLMLEDFKHARYFFGNNLAKVAIKILKQLFDGILMVHMKRRNCLRQQTLNDVMLVMSNSKLAKRHHAGKAMEYSMDNLSSYDEWIAENSGSSSNNEESELDDLCFYFLNEDYKLKGQVGEDADGDGAYVDDQQIHDDDDIEFDDEDGASDATDDVMDGDGSFKEDECCEDFDVNALLL
ncbi:hypothetical protein CR513_49074, partial [Mucuna pruriens]